MRERERKKERERERERARERARVTERERERERQGDREMVRKYRVGAMPSFTHNFGHQIESEIIRKKY